MKNSGRSNRLRLSLLLLLCLLSAALLFSCSAENDVGKTGNTNTTQAPADNTATDDSTLLYYTALVGRFEEEILKLKEEIFLLQYGESTSVDLPTDEDDLPVSQPTEADDYTYRIVDGYAVITAYCGKGGDVVLPASLGGYPVRAIGDSAFANSPVTSVVLPDSVTKIDWFAFRDCLSLTAVVGGESVTEIGYGAFDGCPAALVVICPKGSYLATYAGSFGIAVRNR